MLTRTSVKWESLGMTLLYLYVIISQIAAVSFWLNYVTTPGRNWIEILFLSPILAELRGLFWIFFIW